MSIQNWLFLISNTLVTKRIYFRPDVCLLLMHVETMHLGTCFKKSKQSPSTPHVDDNALAYLNRKQHEVWKKVGRRLLFFNLHTWKFEQLPGWTMFLILQLSTHWNRNTNSLSGIFHDVSRISLSAVIK